MFDQQVLKYICKLRINLVFQYKINIFLLKIGRLFERKMWMDLTTYESFVFMYIERNTHQQVTCCSSDIAEEENLNIYSFFIFSKV